MVLNISNWSEFIETCVHKKHLTLQYREDGDVYEVCAADGPLVWSIRILKESDEGNDFEVNYKDKCNYAIGTYTMPFSVDNMVCAYDGINLTEITEPVQRLYYKIEDDDLFLSGGESGGSNIGIGDWFSMSIVDHDNLLGYGVDFPLKTWVKKKFLRENGCTCHTPYAGQPPKYFYIMVEYHKVGSLTEGHPNPKLWIGFEFHQKVL